MRKKNVEINFHHQIKHHETTAIIAEIYIRKKNKKMNEK